MKAESGFEAMLPIVMRLWIAFCAGEDGERISRMIFVAGSCSRCWSGRQYS